MACLTVPAATMATIPSNVVEHYSLATSHIGLSGLMLSPNGLCVDEHDKGIYTSVEVGSDVHQDLLFVAVCSTCLAVLNSCKPKNRTTMKQAVNSSNLGSASETGEDRRNFENDSASEHSMCGSDSGAESDSTPILSLASQHEKLFEDMKSYMEKNNIPDLKTVSTPNAVSSSYANLFPPAPLRVPQHNYYFEPDAAAASSSSSAIEKRKAFNGLSCGDDGDNEYVDFRDGYYLDSTIYSGGVACEASMSADTGESLAITDTNSSTSTSTVSIIQRSYKSQHSTKCAVYDPMQRLRHFKVRKSCFVNVSPGKKSKNVHNSYLSKEDQGRSPRENQQCAQEQREIIKSTNDDLKRISERDIGSRSFFTATGPDSYGSSSSSSVITATVSSPVCIYGFINRNPEITNNSAENEKDSSSAGLLDIDSEDYIEDGASDEDGCTLTAGVNRFVNQISDITNNSAENEQDSSSAGLLNNESIDFVGDDGGDEEGYATDSCIIWDEPRCDFDFRNSGSQHSRRMRPKRRYCSDVDDSNMSIKRAPPTCDESIGNGRGKCLFVCTCTCIITVSCASTSK